MLKGRLVKQFIRRTTFCIKQGKMPTVLTEDGVSVLYKHRFNPEPNLQVLFMVKDESVWFIRVSDGKHVSPVIIVDTEPKFQVGSVICITERFIKCWDKEETLVFYDCNLAHLYIRKYTVVEEDSILYGSINRNETYRDALFHVKDQLIKEDPALVDFFEEEPEHEKAVRRSEHLREDGNRFFKRNEFYEALTFYDMAKANCMYDHRVWANSSMVHLQLKNYEESEKDALVAIKLNLFFGKGYYRAVSAAMAQSNHEVAWRYSRASKLLTADCEEVHTLFGDIQSEITDHIKKSGHTCGNSVFIELQNAIDRQCEKIKEDIKESFLEKKVEEETIMQHLPHTHSKMNFRINRGRITTIKDIPIDTNGFVEVNGGRCIMQVKAHKEPRKAKMEESAQKSTTTTKTDHVGKKEGKSVHEKKKEEKKELKKRKEEMKKKNEEEAKEKIKVAEEKKNVEALEPISYPNNIFHENLKEGKRLYECGQYRQAGEIYSKNLMYVTLGLEEEEQNEEEEVRIIKFLVGLCKVRSGRQWIIEGMQHLKSLVLESCTFKCPAAHYWLGFGCQEIMLKQMAHHHWQCCLEMMGKVGHVEPMYWPHSRDEIPMTGGDSLKKSASQLIVDNKKECGQEESLKTWNSLPIEPAYLLQRLNMLDDFNKQRKFMENIIDAQICPKMRDLMADIASNHSGVKIPKELPRRKAVELPQPKTRCRYKNCKNTQGVKNPKEDIFPTDPNFKGFLDVACEDYCVVSYHPCCWKAYKEEQESQIRKKMTDRDFLGMPCMTPDCSGKICSIVVHDETGKIKQDIRDKKNSTTNAKQKKKKEKKKEKQAAKAEAKEKKRVKTESVCEDTLVKEETEGKSGESMTQTPKTISAKDVIRSKPAVPLPIDPESLQTGKVIVLKPGVDEAEGEGTKSKKNKKKNKKKSKPTPLSVDEIMGDPHEERNDLLECTNSYIARVQRLRKQRQAEEEEDRIHFGSPQDRSRFILPLFDDENPFYLPKHLQNNPEELEQYLQNKMVLLSSSVIDHDAVQNLLEFVYDWLKATGPVSCKDPQLKDYITDNFPDEAKTYINQCGDITDFLMQCSKFAMVDEIICVREHVMLAQDIALGLAADISSYPHCMISDGCKARKLEQLIEDGRSTCSSASTVSSLKLVCAEGHSRNLSITPEDDMGIDKFEISLSEVNNNLHSNSNTAGNANEKLNNSTTGISNIFQQEEQKEGAKAGNKNTFGIYGSCEAETSMERHCNEGEGTEGHSLNRTKQRKNSPTKNAPSISAIDMINGSSRENSPKELVNDKLSKTDRSEHDDVENGTEDCRSELEVDAEEEPEEHMSGQEEDGSDLWDEYQRTKAENEVLASQNEELKDKFHQLKVKNSVEISALRKEIEELHEQNQKLEKEKKTLNTQKEAENKKLQNEIKRLSEECKTATSQSHSQKISIDTFKDRIYELEKIHAFETETSLKRQHNINALEESLTATTKRAQEAEFKYMSVRTDLLEKLFNREVSRLEEDVQHLRQLLYQTAEDTIPDRKTVLRAIVGGDEKIKWYKDTLKFILDEGNQMLKMIATGRPLNALSPGDLQIPYIPETFNVSSLFGIVQHHQKQRNFVPNMKDTKIDEDNTEEKRRLDVVLDSPALSASKSPSPGTEAKLVLQANNCSGPPPGFVSGAIPKGAGTSSPRTTPDAPDTMSHPNAFSDANKLFVGQLPWATRECDLKELFQEYGEVVAVNIIDKGYNSEGKPVPKHGYVTFRHKESRQKALESRPIMIDNRALNVQEKESRKSGNVPVTAGMGLDNMSSDGASSAYGLSEISLNVDAAKEAIPKALQLNTPHGPPINSAFNINSFSNTGLPKPKFQTLRGTDSTGTFGPILKMGRPQAKHSSGTKSPLLMTPKPNEVNNLSYQRLIEVCQTRLGSEHALMDIHRSLRELRKQNKNAMVGLSEEGVVQKVEAMLLRTKRNGSVGPSVAPWADLAMDKKDKTKWGSGDQVLTAEEPCSICLESMETYQTCSLPCCHTFHEGCIKDWLKRSSNCPNCRTFALMNDEYPSLK